MILKNPLATQHKTPGEKIAAFTAGCKSGAMAHKSDGTSVALKTLQPNQVEFIAGLWRVQDETNYEIRQIRDRQLILGERMPHRERTLFEFYQAMQPTFNCYGLICNGFDIVVAKYTTNSGTFWGYGRNIEQARAFLGIKLYDAHQELINDVLNKQNIK
ncbi:MAG: hypothetical protein NC311_01875 [Muribaculaceae bacterium]|nr:hypothetical protein [Muribaculaceae bacterium]